jgi:trehalose synthase-fused probable maltokinase
VTRTAPALPPTVSVGGNGAAEDALSPATLRSIASADLGRWMASRRWFGAKGHTPNGARFSEIVPLSLGDDRAVVTRVVVGTGDGAEHSYQLALVARAADPAYTHATAAVLAHVDTGAQRGALIDALEDARFRASLGAAFAHGAAFEGEGARWWIEPVGDGAPGLQSEPSEVVRAEQSNTSVRYGDRAILKLFRRLEHGENPDVEVCAFLTTKTTFRHVPKLLGLIRYSDATGGTYVAGMLSQLVVGAEDGWTAALDSLRRALTSTGDPPVNEFLAAAAKLGKATGELHQALAASPDTPGFGSEPVTDADLDRWAAATRTSIDRALTLLGERAATLGPRQQPMARAIAARHAAVIERLDAVVLDARRALDTQRDSAHAPRKTRHHGDYHLGQVLRDTAGDWFIVDFEGEPARPLAERRALQSPLRDVAGMLRSFAYAAATAAAQHGGVGVVARTEIIAAHWERDVRAAFLNAYGAAANDPPPLIALFEMEKMFYELTYELNHRPDWVWIPLRAVAKGM